MATLTQILHQRSRAQANLEKGTIYTFTPATALTQFRDNSCVGWIAPANGMAVIELWGASGSGARMCCCGFGLPGNPGGYVKKYQCVAAGDWIRGIIGMSCGNADALCFRGCSQSTCMTICRVGCCCICLCAEGGRGGITYCSTGTGAFCCFGRSGWFASECFRARGYPGDCGMACNWCANWNQFGRGWGGDVNKYGGTSCVSFLGTSGSRACCYIHHTAVSPGIVADDGVVLSWMNECDSIASAATGAGQLQLLYNLGLATKRPTMQHMIVGCWNGNKHCSCYESNGCVRFNPPGVPGSPFMHGDGNVRGQGFAGGHGMMKIKFMGNS